MQEPFRKARVCITTLLMIEAFLGALIIAITGVYHHQLDSFLADTDQKLLNGPFFTTYMLGVQLFLTYLCSLQLWKIVWAQRCTSKIVLLLTVWMLFCFLISICGCGTIWTLFLCASVIESSVETSLRRGIDLYYSCPEWKLLWDGLQFYRQCCGVHGYMDWMAAIWMPNDPLQLTGTGSSEQTDLIGMNSMATQEPETCASTLAPYACCKHSCNTCFDNYAPRSGGNGIPFLNLTQINTGGCLVLFSESLWHLIYVLVAIVVVVIHVDIILCYLTRYIIRRQSNFLDNSSYNLASTDGGGCPMVVLECPGNMRCVTVEQDKESNSSDDDRSEDHPTSCFSGGCCKSQEQRSKPKQIDTSPSRKGQRCRCCDRHNHARFVH